MPRCYCLIWRRLWLILFETAGKLIHLHSVKYHCCCNEQNKPSVLWHNCWLRVRKSIRLVKNEGWGASDLQFCTWSSWCNCHSIVTCFIKIQTGLTFLMPAYAGCPGEEVTLSPLTFARHLKVHLFCWLTAHLRTICDTLYKSTHHHHRYH